MKSAVYRVRKREEVVGVSRLCARDLMDSRARAAADSLSDVKITVKNKPGRGQIDARWIFCFFSLSLARKL